MSRLLGSKAEYICAQCASRLARRRPRQRALIHTESTSVQPGLLDLLEARGYVNQIAGDREILDARLRERKVGFYAGIDPTAPSLHLGHLLPLMVLFWAYNHGHNIVSLVGGATARVGDPSGRLQSRAKTAENVHDANFKSMFSQLGEIWENARQYGRRHGYDGSRVGKVELLNNAAWLERLSILDFLKTMGHGMRLGAMLSRDTVRNKMERGDGMSFSEFTYPLLQGWDWWHMYKHNNVQVQIGGSDQYGNIVAGMDAVKYIAANEGNDADPWLTEDGKLKEELAPMGLTVPLLTTASGEKFGKSAGNAVWLDPTMTSPFDLYGFLLRSGDQEVERYLKLFTFVPTAQIQEAMAEHAAEPAKRKAQHLLASEVLELVHGREQAAKTRAEHQALRSPRLSALAQSVGDRASDADGNQQRTVLPTSLALNTPFSRILYHAGIVATKSEGARAIANGGVYVAGPSLTPTDGIVGTDDLRFVQLRDQKPGDVMSFVIDGMLIFRLGKWKVRVVEVVEDAEFDARGLTAPGWEEHKAINSVK